MNPLSAQPILITGGAGFLGSYLARLLVEAGQPVCVYDISGFSDETRFVLGATAPSITVELGSVDDWPRLMEVVARHQPSHIVHSAAIVDVARLFHSPLTALRTNVEGTLHVLEAARLYGVARVVYFSSIGVLPNIQYEPIDAAHPIILPTAGPASGAYGAAKVSGEAFCFAYQQAFGLDCRIIRPSAAYGFGMRWHSANYMKQFVEPAVQGQAVRLASGGALQRDYTHAHDIARLALAVLNAPTDADRVFYAATGERLVTAAQVANIVRELVPGADIFIEDGLSAEDRLELGFRGQISIENARQQLGWEPHYRSLRDGIGEYIERYRAYLAQKV